MTIPKLASNNLWTYVCWEMSQQVRLQVVGAPCWLGTLPSVLLGVRNRYIFPSNLPKCLKWLQKALLIPGAHIWAPAHSLLLFLGLFLKISRSVPLLIIDSTTKNSKDFGLIVWDWTSEDLYEFQIVTTLYNTHTSLVKLRYRLMPVQ